MFWKYSSQDLKLEQNNTQMKNYRTFIVFNQLFFKAFISQSYLHFPVCKAITQGWRQLKGRGYSFPGDFFEVLAEGVGIYSIAFL